MGLVASITKLDKNFGWSFLGFVLAAVFGALSLYTEFWKQNTPRLEFELLSNTPVLDVRERLSDLEVLYQGKDIARGGKTLSVILVRVVNRGSANLLSMHYDSKVPIGLDIAGDALIRAELSGTSNEYLAKAAGVVAKDASVTFEPVILEPGEWFLVKLLVLHSIGSQPTVSAHGKVAGMHSVPVILTIPATEKESFLYHVFSGSMWTQLVRLVAYFFGAILFGVAVVIPPMLILDSLSTRRRRKLVARFKAATKVPLTDADQFVFDGFVLGGLQYVQRLTNAVADPERLQSRVSTFLATKDQPPSDTEMLPMEEAMVTEISIDGRRVHYPRRYFDVAPMMKHGFIVESGGKWMAVPERLKVATSFIEYVELFGATNV